MKTIVVGILLASSIANATTTPVRSADPKPPVANRIGNPGTLAPVLAPRIPPCTYVVDGCIRVCRPATVVTRH
jgi:hypothetical protein